MGVDPHACPGHASEAGGSDERETETTVVESSTSVLVKNKVLPTTTRIPSTIKAPYKSGKKGP